MRGRVIQSVVIVSAWLTSSASIDYRSAWIASGVENSFQTVVLAANSYHHSLPYHVDCYWPDESGSSATAAPPPNF